MFCCPEEHLCQRLLGTRAAADVDLSALRLLLRLRLRQRSLLRLGREGVRGTSVTCPEVRELKPATPYSLVSEYKVA